MDAQSQLTAAQKKNLRKKLKRSTSNLEPEKKGKDGKVRIQDVDAMVAAGRKREGLYESMHEKWVAQYGQILGVPGREAIHVRRDPETGVVSQCGRHVHVTALQSEQLAGLAEAIVAFLEGEKLARPVERQKTSAQRVAMLGEQKAKMAEALRAHKARQSSLQSTKPAELAKIQADLRADRAIIEGLEYHTTWLRQQLPLHLREEALGRFRQKVQDGLLLSVQKRQRRGPERLEAAVQTPSGAVSLMKHFTHNKSAQAALLTLAHREGVDLSKDPLSAALAAFKIHAVEIAAALVPQQHLTGLLQKKFGVILEKVGDPKAGKRCLVAVGADVTPFAEWCQGAPNVFEPTHGCPVSAVVEYAITAGARKMVGEPAPAPLARDALTATLDFEDAPRVEAICGALLEQDIFPTVVKGRLLLLGLTSREPELCEWLTGVARSKAPVRARRPARALLGSLPILTLFARAFKGSEAPVARELENNLKVELRFNLDGAVNSPTQAQAASEEATVLVYGAPARRDEPGDETTGAQTDRPSERSRGAATERAKDGSATARPKDGSTTERAKDGSATERPKEGGTTERTEGPSKNAPLLAKVAKELKTLCDALTYQFIPVAGLPSAKRFPRVVGRQKPVVGNGGLVMPSRGLTLEAIRAFYGVTLQPAQGALIVVGTKPAVLRAAPAVTLMSKSVGTHASRTLLGRGLFRVVQGGVGALAAEQGVEWHVEPVRRVETIKTSAAEGLVTVQQIELDADPCTHCLTFLGGAAACKAAQQALATQLTAVQSVTRPLDAGAIAWLLAPGKDGVRLHAIEKACSVSVELSKAEGTARLVGRAEDLARAAAELDAARQAGIDATAAAAPPPASQEDGAWAVHLPTSCNVNFYTKASAARAEGRAAASTNEAALRAALDAIDAEGASIEPLDEPERHLRITAPAQEPCERLAALVVKAMGRPPKSAREGSREFRTDYAPKPTEPRREATKTRPNTSQSNHESTPRQIKPSDPTLFPALA